MTRASSVVIETGRRLQEFSFNLNWNGVEVQLELNTRGKLSVRNLAKLPESDQIFFQKVTRLAAKIESAAQPQQLIDSLQNRLRVGRQSRNLPVKKRAGLTPKGEDPFDYYYVSLRTNLPRVVADIVSSINVFMLFLAALFLIPTVTDTVSGILAAISFSALAMGVQLFSKFLNRKLGIAKSRLIQDIFSLITLSLSSFGALRVLADIFFYRALQLNHTDQNPQTNFAVGVTSIAVACIGAVASWFMPAVSVMGPRIQAAALYLERECLKPKTEHDAAFRDRLIKEFKENDGISLAERLFCTGRKRRMVEYGHDERMINLPSPMGAVRQLGGAFVRSAQFSLAVGINAGVIEAFLLPMALFGLLHPFLNRPIIITSGYRHLMKLPPMSSQAPALGVGLKWGSELCSVGSNSFINPSIAFFFVFQKILSAFQTDTPANDAIRFSGTQAVLLALATLLNLTSLVLDLSSRRLGIDRFEGWSASRLSYIVETSQNSSQRQNLEDYLQLLTDCVNGDIELPGALPQAQDRFSKIPPITVARSLLSDTHRAQSDGTDVMLYAPVNPLFGRSAHDFRI